LSLRHRISRRYIHKLFEREQTSLSRFVLGERLTRVHRMLADPRHADRTIAAIAFSAGFGDLSTFNREFRRRLGVMPSEVRHRGQQASPMWLSRKLVYSLERCIDRGSQPTVHAAGEAGVAAQEKAATFLLALDAGAALDDGP